MDVRLLEKNDIEEARALWKSAFEDSDEFLDFYFGSKIPPGNSIGIFDGGLKSVLHMVPYNIRIQGRSIQTAFIAGAATAKDSRKKGLMKRLLHESLELLRSRGILMTHLYPFLHSFYEQFGWATYTYVIKNTAKRAKAEEHVMQTDDSALLHSMYQNMTRSMDGYVIRSGKEWKWRLTELFTDGGKAPVLYENGVPVCYMMYFIDGSKAEVIEAVYEKEEYAHRLAAHIVMDFDEVTYNTVSQDTCSAPHGMARVVDAAELLKEFGIEGILEKTKIVDDFASWNNIGTGEEILGIDQLARAVHMGFDRALGRCGAQYGDMAKTKINDRSTCIFEEY